MTGASTCSNADRPWIRASACVLLVWAGVAGGALWAQDATDVDGGHVYRLDEPEAIHRLPKVLKEISGLTVLDERHLAAVQDEKGSFFVIDYLTGAVQAEVDFGKGGDYEGIERVEDRLFILRSDGRLFEVEDWRAEDVAVAERETALPRGCDAEGLAYDVASGRLLIACKEKAGPEYALAKAIYAFDLERGVRLEEPVCTIPTSAFIEAMRRQADEGVNDWLRSFLAPAIDLSGFKPSGVAVHPLTGSSYVLSSVRKAIVVLDRQGHMVEVLPLSKTLHEQPEGIAFLPNGDLFIASEGDAGEATLAHFTYRYR